MADVAIVGFGPVGATLAGLLGLRGLDVLVLERDHDVFPLPRAAHIDHTGLRTLQELGCLDQLMPEMLANEGLDYVNAEHQVLVRIPGNQRTVSGLPASMYFHQPSFDRTLRATAARLPNVEVRLGTDVSDPASLDATWVVGCDGAASTVRAAAGIALEDLGFDQRWIVVDLVFRASPPKLPRRALGLCDPARPLFALPLPGRRYRFELMVLPGERPEPERALELLGDWIPPGGAVVERAAVYEFHGLVARCWRVGRLLLAGDAAHQMPPFVGQGLCSGLRDACNLAWKLDLVVHERAEPALLDTYAAERRPHVRRIVSDVLKIGELLCELDPRKAAQRDESILARRNGAPSPGRFTLPALVDGPLVLAGGGELFPQPDRFDDTVGQRFLVLGRSPAALGTTGGWWSSVLDALVLSHVPHAELCRWLDEHDADVVVVRPDRYVLGASRTLDPITEAMRQHVRAA